MRPEIDLVLQARGGAASRRDLLQTVSVHAVDNEIKLGHLCAVFPHAYARPWQADDLNVRDRAALASVGPAVAISHTSALRRWGLSIDEDAVHVTTTADHRVRGNGRLIVHRTKLPLPCLDNHGILTVLAGAAVVQAWSVSPKRRARVIEVVRRGLATPADIMSAAETATRLPRRFELLELADLLAAGCESELEIWGHLRVFDIPGLRHGRQQLPVRVAGQRFRIDQAYEPEKVAVEMDGDRFHSTREQRERDRRRDVALATIGWLTVRFSHRRLTTDPEGCQRELLAVLATRRQRASFGA